MSDQKKNFRPCSVIILAAGYSSRMERPKLALSFDKNLTFLEKIIQEYYQFGCKEIIIVLNKEGEYLANRLFLKLKNARIVLNEHPEWERFYSVKLGLQGLSQQHPVFIHNVDNPFVNTKILESLLSQDVNTDYIVPSFDGKGGHPILISNKVCQALISAEKNDLVLSDFLKGYDKKRVIVDDKRILININTHTKYQEFFG